MLLGTFTPTTRYTVVEGTRPGQTHILSIFTPTCRGGGGGGVPDPPGGPGGEPHLTLGSWGGATPPGRPANYKSDAVYPYRRVVDLVLSPVRRTIAPGTGRQAYSHYQKKNDRNKTRKIQRRTYRVCGFGAVLRVRMMRPGGVFS